ncbi:MAG: D-2-hydroxyacid dehydrogenase (NADP+) [Hyphomicrobiaceae bacterium]|jgi:D-2-hydroxyacid dehydrogenase (NADP+)
MSGAIAVSDFIEARMAEELDRLAPHRQRVVLRGERFSASLDEVEIALFSGDLYPDRSRSFFLPLLEAPRLAWMHTYSAGVDHPIFSAFTDRGIRLTTSSGAAAIPIAQTVIMYLLMLTRDAARWAAAQRQRTWAPHQITELEGARLLVCGLGPIGMEVARLGQTMGMEVTGLRRKARTNEPFEVRELAALDAELPNTDAIVVALPSNRDTQDLFNAARFDRVKPGALFINVARGDLVDETALLAALGQGRLAGAALDVTREEPLPPNSPLWDAPNLILTPHSSGHSLRSHDRAAQLFLDNLARYELREELFNLVKPKQLVKSIQENSK